MNNPSNGMLARFQARIVEPASHGRLVQQLRHENELLKLKYQFVQDQLSTEKETWRKMIANLEQQIETMTRQNQELSLQMEFDKVKLEPAQNRLISRTTELEETNIGVTKDQPTTKRNYDVSALLTPEPTSPTEEKKPSPPLTLEEIFADTRLPELLDKPDF